MSLPETPIPFLQRLKQAAQSNHKSVETFVTDAITAHIAREQAKAKGTSTTTK